MDKAPRRWKIVQWCLQKY